MRLIARLDIKNNYLIKSIKYDGVRKIGNIIDHAEKYYINKIDEIIITNVTGSLYKTKLDLATLNSIRKKVHIPLSCGGGIQSVEDALSLMQNGSDKIIINSIIHEDINVAEKIINTIGSSSVVGSIQYSNEKNFATYYRMGREKTGLNLRETIQKYNKLGVGEILLTNINKEGTFSGLDKDVINLIKEYNFIPILIGGGFKSSEELHHFKNNVSAVVISSSLHYNKVDIKTLIQNINNHEGRY